MVSRTRVTSNYRVTIPKEIRQKTGVEAGDKFQVTSEGDSIFLRKISKKA